MTHSDQDPAKFPLQAAQYVRMSTDNQRFSIENQQAAIKRFAELNGITIVKEYADRGKSGLSTRGRLGLLKLLSDIREGEANFSLLLVYDVSRWGRFQDPDESAYYEFLCRRAGVQVLYCAERFENDNSPMSTVLKSLKRAMAAEYSRELSEKVFRGLVSTAKRGFNPGGDPGFGLRRLLVDAEGRPRMLLERGQRKALASDRVMVVPGPIEELKAVQNIFQLYVNDRCTMEVIAALLNERGLSTGLGNPWSGQSVRRTLRNERYIGVQTFNRTSRKLRRKIVANPPDEWIRTHYDFEPIVPPELFAQAQEVMSSRRWDTPDEELLLRLKDCWKRWGVLSDKVIDEDPHLPSRKTFAARFRGLTAAYNLIGYQRPRNSRNGAHRQTEVETRNELLRALRELGRMRGLELIPDSSGRILKFSGWPVLRVLVLRARPTSEDWTVWCWQANQIRNEDLVLLVRLDRKNRKILDQHLVPRLVLERRPNRILSDPGQMRGFFAYKVNDLAEVAARLDTHVR